MKKLILAILILLLFIPAALAEVEGPYEYRLLPDSTAEITHYLTPEKKTTYEEIPGTLGGKPVTEPFSYFDKGNMATISRFRAIAEIENRHHARFEAYIKQIETGTVWKREVPIKWQCLVCGYVYEGLEPPKVCPACDHPYQHYIALDMDEL